MPYLQQNVEPWKGDPQLHCLKVVLHKCDQQVPSSIKSSIKKSHNHGFFAEDEVYYASVEEKLAQKVDAEVEMYRKV